MVKWVVWGLAVSFHAGNRSWRPAWWSGDVFIRETRLGFMIMLETGRASDEWQRVQRECNWIMYSVPLCSWCSCSSDSKNVSSTFEKLRGREVQVDFTFRRMLQLVGINTVDWNLSLDFQLELCLLCCYSLSASNIKCCGKPCILKPINKLQDLQIFFCNSST